MKIYAIRDKLINYYMVPFAAPNDNDVKAGIANAVNNLEENSAIAQAPSQFEIWHLGEVTEDGCIVADKFLVCDANTLIRPVTDRQRISKEPPRSEQSPPERFKSERGTNPAAPQN